MLARVFRWFRRPPARAPRSVRAVPPPRIVRPAPGTPLSIVDVVREQVSPDLGEVLGLSWHDLVATLRDMPDLVPAAPLAFPGVTTRVCQLLRDPAYDMNELVGLVMRDGGIVTALLRMANSALFAPAAPIVDLRAAITMLGTQQTLEVVVGCSGQAFYDVPSATRVGTFSDLRRQMFREAIANAFTAGRAAFDMGVRDPESALIAGLLVDVGRPVALRAVTNLVRGGHPRPPEVITSVAIDEVSTMIADRMIAAMDLPDELRRACMYDPLAPSKEATLARMISAIGAIQRHSPRSWRYANEVVEYAAILGLSPFALRAQFALRATYLELAVTLFGG